LIAEALGKSIRQAKADIAKLEKFCLIRHNRWRCNSNIYEFLWHAIFKVQLTALQQVGLEVQDDLVLEGQPTALESSQLESCPLNSEKADNEIENSVKGWTQRELTEVRRRIIAFWGREPEEGFEVSVMLRARGASAGAVCELLNRKYTNPNCRPGGRLAPRNPNWFLTVIENEFAPGYSAEYERAFKLLSSRCTEQSRRVN
jgi:hypothetical protein